MQTFNEWLATVPDTITGDPLWKMKAYRLAVFLGDLAWHDVTNLVSDQRTVKLADQLFRAVGSIGANIAEGYSRRSGKDRGRFYEYALGSARESRHWYYAGDDTCCSIRWLNTDWACSPKSLACCWRLFPRNVAATWQKSKSPTKSAYLRCWTTHPCPSGSFVMLIRITSQ